jgi:hypothetical protein
MPNNTPLVTVESGKSSVISSGNCGASRSGSCSVGGCGSCGAGRYKLNDNVLVDLLFWSASFHPNLFCAISPLLEAKLHSIYQQVSEVS